MSTRFHCPGPLCPGELITLPEAAAHHALRVLRLRDGAPLVLFNGSGGECAAHLLASGKSAKARIIAQDAIERERCRPVRLAQCLAAGDRMDWIVQKGVELGVAAIEPLASQRSVTRLEADRAERRVEHWHKIVIGACEQCGRNRLPDLAAPVDLRVWLSRPPDGLRLVLLPDASIGLAQWWQVSQPAPGAPITLLVGPEGGLTSEEAAAATAAGFLAVRCGSRVMRTETAGLAALAALAALDGDL